MIYGARNSDTPDRGWYYVPWWHSVRLEDGRRARRQRLFRVWCPGNTLRHAKGECVRDAGTAGIAPFSNHRVAGAVTVDRFIAQERDQVPGRGKADTDHN